MRRFVVNVLQCLPEGDTDIHKCFVATILRLGGQHFGSYDRSRYNRICVIIKRVITMADCTIKIKFDLWTRGRNTYGGEGQLKDVPLHDLHTILQCSA